MNNDHDFIDSFLDGELLYCKNCFIDLETLHYSKKLQTISCKKMQSTMKTHSYADSTFKCIVCGINSAGIKQYIYTCNEYLMIKANE